MHTRQGFDTVAIYKWMLYDKLKGRKVELKIGDEDDITISQEAIRQALISADKVLFILADVFKI